MSPTSSIPIRKERLTTNPRSWHGMVESRWVVPAIIALALVLRLAVIIAFPIMPGSDSAWYFIRAQELAAGMGFQERGWPTAYWPIGYPALIAIPIAIFGPNLFGPILLNLLAEAAIILMILWFARRLGAGEAAARLAALLYAIYPSHIVNVGDTVAEPTSTAIAMAGTALLIVAPRHPWRALAAGIAFGLATLMRPQTMLFPPVVLVLMMLTISGFGWRRIVPAAALVAVGMALTILPWTARNMAVMKAPVLVSTNGGIALIAGANDFAYGGYFGIDQSPLWNEIGIPLSQRVERQVEIDNRLRTMAKRWIAEHPGRWFLLGFRKVALLWLLDTDGFWSLDRSYPNLGAGMTAAKALNQLFYLAALVAAIIGFAMSAWAAWRRKPAGPLLIMASMPLFCSAIAFGFSGQTRYHYSAMPFVMVAAAFALVNLWSARRGAASGAAA